MKVPRRLNSDTSLMGWWVHMDKVKNRLESKINRFHENYKIQSRE